MSAPAFRLLRSEYASVSLADLRGHRVILVLYPCAFEPVSWEQLALYQDYLPQFGAFDAQLIGVSADCVWCHSAFAKRAGIRFPLLSDMPPRGALSRQYGAYREEEEVTRRALIVIDRGGIIRFSRVYPDLLNPGVGDLLDVLEDMAEEEKAALI